MSSEQNHYNSSRNKPTDAETNEPTIKDVIRRTLKHWVWLVLSVVICVGLGVLIILTSPKKYNESAQVVIKNDSEGGSSAISSNFSDLGLFSRNTNVLNEIATMSSPDVMTEVVKMLNLDIEYFAPGTFHKKVLYGNTLPVVATFPGMTDKEQVSFKVEIDPKGSFVISKLKKYNLESNKWEKISGTFRGKLGTPLKTPVGTIQLSPTENYVGDEDLEIIINKNSLAGTTISYVNRLEIELDDEDSTVVNLSIIDQNIQRANEILAAVIAVYNANWIEEKNNISASTSKFITERLGVIEQELGEVDSDISDYKSANLVPDVRTTAESYVKESEQLTQQILELEVQLQAADNLKRHLTSAGSEGKALPGNTTLENPALLNQINDYNDLLLKRNSLVEKSSDKNPVVRSLDGEISQMRGAILSSVDNAIQSLQRQISTLQSAKGRTTQRLASSPTQAKYLLSVERQQMVKENLYLFLLQRREDNELSQAFTAYNTRIIKKPGGDGIPVSPRKAFILFTSFLLGFFIPFSYNFFSEKWDTKVRSRKDLEGLRTPMIGEIPIAKNIKKSKEDKAEMLIAKGSRDIINEAFRVLRTNIEFTRIHKDGCNVVAFTSFNPGSGKSFISMNLGATLALKGKRVLVIDGDFRRGSTSEYVDNPSKGLADYLAGHETDYTRLIVEYPEIDNLYVLPVGKMPPNPTELIETPKFEELIENLRHDYDYVFVDCPPIEIVADASIIDKVADRTIFVVRAGLLERASVPDLDRLYAEKKFHNMAFILNGTTHERSAYGKYASNGKFAYGNQ